MLITFSDSEMSFLIIMLEDYDISFLPSSKLEVWFWGSSTSFMSTEEEEDESKFPWDLVSSICYNWGLVLFSPTSPLEYEGVSAGAELRIML